ncbi:hypothetical protein L4D77_15570 [Photobacterium frigidiphilum]|uniref:hypothetical protein n=1 Tax=Photobacterium frigidiphilum TaxID=264736 RepID=UPI003D10A125
MTALYRVNIKLPEGIVRVGKRGKYKFSLENAQALMSEYQCYGYDMFLSTARAAFTYQNT